MYDGAPHLPIKVNPAGDPGDLRLRAAAAAHVSTFSGNHQPVMSALANFGPGQPLYLLFFVG